jgi:gluconolactonase
VGTPRRFAGGFAFPEGPAFDGEGNLYLVAMGSGDIPRARPDGTVEVFVNTEGQPNGLAFGPGGVLHVCDAGRRAILTVDPDGAIRTLADAWGGGARPGALPCAPTGSAPGSASQTRAGGPFAGPNDLCFDPAGGFYFTDPVGSDVDNPIGRVFHYGPSGQASCVAEGLAFPNGLALTADAKTLYVVETLTRLVHAYEVRPDGGLGEREVFAAMREGGVGGDGMALDVVGNVYVAHFGLGTVDVFGPGGEALGELDAGGKNPTNVAFGGPDGQDLYITETEAGCVNVQRGLAPGLRLF